jgi:hypothetical protein
MSEKSNPKKFKSVDPTSSAKELKLPHLFFGITVIGLSVALVSQCAKDGKPPKPPRHLSGAPKTKQKAAPTKAKRRGYELSY